MRTRIGPVTVTRTHHAARALRDTSRPPMSRFTDPTSLDTMFDTLSDPHCRRVLWAISEYGLRDADEFSMAAFVSGEMGGEDPDVLRIKLFHSSLPKLADRGYVEWNPDVETLRRGPNFSDLAPLLRLLVEHEAELPADLP